MLVNDNNAVIETLTECFRNGGKLLLFGCGGSASTAEHIASEFVSHWSGVHLPAIALNNVSTITAIGNDFGFEYIYSKQIEALGRSGDVAIGITTSGSAVAVVRGLVAAMNRGLKTVALVGEAWTHISCPTHVITTACVDTAAIQNDHLDWGHWLSDRVCREPQGETCRQ